MENILENIIRGGISSVLADRNVKSDENIKIIYLDANNIYGHSTSQSLPYGEIKFERNVCLEKILNIPDNSVIGIFLKVDIRYPYNKGQKTKNYPFCPEKKPISKNDFND